MAVADYPKGATILFALANVDVGNGRPFARGNPQVEPPVSARKTFRPPPAMAPRPPVLRHIDFGAEERPGPQFHQPPAPRRGGSTVKPKLGAAPQPATSHFMNLNALGYEAEGSNKIPEHQAIWRMENNQFNFDKEDVYDEHIAKLQARLKSDAPQTEKAALIVLDPLDERNAGSREEPQTITKTGDIAPAHRGGQRLEMQPIRAMNSPRPPIQESGKVASEPGERIPHIMRRHS
jgi:hypothetical protein